MNRRDRRRAERDRGLGRVGRMTRSAVAAALVATGVLAAGFGHMLHLPQVGLDDRSHSTSVRDDPAGGPLQGPDQVPGVPQAPPVSVSGGS